MSYSNWNVVFGPPGTGKTTFGMKFIEQQLERGIDPSTIGYIAFTRKAANEAKERAQQKFNLTDEDLHYFRTIHSLCFMQLGMNPSNILSKEHFKELGELLGVETTGSGLMNEEAYNLSLPMGDRLFFLDNLSRITRTSLKSVYERTVDDDVSYDQLVIASKTLLDYKKKHKLKDFTDLLEEWIKKGSVPRLNSLFVDEAQDLSKLQWEVVKKIGNEVPLKYAAGDDDQAIYRWAGAAVDEFIDLPGHKEVLSKSWRIPRVVHSMATDLLKNITKRQPKEFNHNGNEGSCQYYFDAADIDMSKGTWLCLGRNAYLLKEFERICEVNGFPYESPSRKPLQSATLRAIKDWTKLGKGETIVGKRLKTIRRFHGFKMKIDDERVYTLADLPVDYADWYDAFKRIDPLLREYFLAAKRQGEQLNKPRILINTIHGVKGGEAEHVAIRTDMAARSYKYMEMFPDDEHRVFYVALTRAKESIHLISPSSRLFYEI